jgi:pSer/pThr/pTyr-binding forkhead associated (FHA) protein
VSKKNGEESNKILIGRHDQCHIQLKRSEVSRKQAKIYVDIDGQWII